jgi:hypothetical protein
MPKYKIMIVVIENTADVPSVLFEEGTKGKCLCPFLKLLPLQ